MPLCITVKKIRFWPISLWVALLLLISKAFVVQAQENSQQKPLEVVDSALGESLYYYYQGEDVQALSVLLVAKERAELQENSVAASLLEGALAVRFGLYKRAHTLLEALLEGTLTPSMRERVWLQLAALQYQQGIYAEVKQALDQIEEPVLSHLSVRYLNLKALLALAQGQTEQAASVYKQMPNYAPQKAYLHHNIALKYFTLEDKSVFQNWIEISSDWREAKWKGSKERVLLDRNHMHEKAALEDRVLLLEGYSHLQVESYESAGKAFASVRRKSPYLSEALLGQTYNALGQKQLAQAHRALEWLLKLEPSSLNAQSALLALAKKEEEAEQYVVATGLYKQALDAYELAYVGLEKGLITENYLPSLLDFSYDDLLERLNEPDTKATEPKLKPLLLELVLNSQFRKAFMKVEELLKLKVALQKGDNTIEGLWSAYEVKTKLRLEKASDLNRQTYSERLKRLWHSQQLTETNIQALEIQFGDLAFAEEELLGYWQQYERAKNSLNIIKQSNMWSIQELAQHEETLRLIRGALLWNAAEQALDRRWLVKKNHKVITVALKEADERLTRIDKEIKNTPDLVELKQRLEALGLRQAELEVQISDLFDSAYEALKGEVKQFFQQKMARLQVTKQEARLGLARIEDARWLRGSSHE